MLRLSSAAGHFTAIIDYNNNSKHIMLAMQQTFSKCLSNYLSNPYNNSIK